MGAWRSQRQWSDWILGILVIYQRAGMIHVHMVDLVEIYTYYQEMTLLTSQSNVDCWTLKLGSASRLAAGQECLGREEPGSSPIQNGAEA